MSDEDTLAAWRRELWKQGLAIVLSGAGLLATVGGTFYVRVTAEEARNQEIHARIERDVESLQRDQREATTRAENTQGDLRALKASFEAGQADTRARLIRIENGLDALDGLRRR